MRGQIGSHANEILLIRSFKMPELQKNTYKLDNKIEIKRE